MAKFEGFYELENLPIKAGDTVTIKKGTMVKAFGKPATPAYKTYKVKVEWIDQGSSMPTIPLGSKEPPKPYSNPRIVWAGSGGRWVSSEINDIPEAQS